MKRKYNLSQLEWKVAGFTPYQWQMGKSMEIGDAMSAEIVAIPAKVPGSVQTALLEAGLIPDWNKGLNAPSCEWVENRHWIYETRIPDSWLDGGTKFRLNCLGLDYRGRVIVNGRVVSTFKGSFIPHSFEISPYLHKKDNYLQIVFECPPRWLGQLGYTSRIKEWKPRFNYTWDWIPRLVQVGIWDSIFLESTHEEGIHELRCTTNVNVSKGTGSLEIKGSIQGDKRCLIRVSLRSNGSLIRAEEIQLRQFLDRGITWDNLSIDLWWPNGQGEQPLYTLCCQLLTSDGKEIDKEFRRIGFKHVEWKPCEGAPDEANPWICVVNGKPIFLQGVNWTPIRPNFADVTVEGYRQRLVLYHALGCNIIRIWGGAFLEKECLYDICDELGLLIWQEFPLSSSGIDNWPPEDETSIAELAEIARSYIARRQHHVSLTLWCGGNELSGLSENKSGTEKPVDVSHPLIKQLQRIVVEQDPTRRFLATSPSGPRIHASRGDFGKGLHWDMHGPWKPIGNLSEEWSWYWQNDDALFWSEVGSPGASSAEIIREYLGDCNEVPGTVDNPLWRRTSWWIEWPEFVKENGREPQNLEEYVAWSQNRQKKALAIAAKACKERFPRCGGFIIWMGHDCFPCTANTSILDFYGKPKPAAEAIGEIFRKP